VLFNSRSIDMVEDFDGVCVFGDMNGNGVFLGVWSQVGEIVSEVSLGWNERVCDL
jgi:hypothetical protein